MAGGRKAGYLAVILDVEKGEPFVALAHSFFGLPDAVVKSVRNGWLEPGYDGRRGCMTGNPA
ncbi:hypothetical protein ACFLU9_02220 [Chloroflexota bacterium]